MRERHNWAEGKHPKACTCTTCQQRRADAALPRPKKKKKPKSMRGKKRPDASSALSEALDILGFAAPSNDEDVADEAARDARDDE